jgi:hypothetical protein
MKEQKFPAGWDAARVKNLIAHYEQMDDSEMIAEDEAAQEMAGQTLMVIPSELVPEVRALINRKTSA